MGTWRVIFDLLLAAALILAAGFALFWCEVFGAVVLFIAFGFFMALAWVQLGDADVALAEAAIGAGLTGALLLGALRQFESRLELRGNSVRRRLVFAIGPSVARAFVPTVLTVSCLSLSGLLWVSLERLRPVRSGLLPLVLEHLSDAGVEHPVTAVLLNFRALDTWLEIGVLSLAALSILVLHQAHHGIGLLPEPRVSHQATVFMARLMLPLLFIIGGIVFWAGGRKPGGAFQAGALIGAAGVLLQLAGRYPFLSMSPPLFRTLLIMGFLGFLICASGTALLRRSMLEYPVPMAGAIILLLEGVAMISIAIILNVMYAGNGYARSDSVHSDSVRRGEK